MVRHDIAVIGGGVIGCAVARHLAESLDVCVLEKEYRLAQHQSGRNSGVIHPGFSYAPGSLQAELATRGARRLKAFCREHGVAVEEGGMLVVAHDDGEERRVRRLHENGRENGVETELLESEVAIREHEPHATGQVALYSPEAGSVDFEHYAHALARDAERRGVDFYMGHKAHGVEERADGVAVRTDKGTVEADYLVNAAGLYADRIARSLGYAPEYRIVPFRGVYYELVPDRRSLVRSNVYPAPHPEYTSVGIHFTRRTDGKVIAGPNVALAPGREAYGRTEFDLGDIADTLGFGGFWRFIGSPSALRVAKDEIEKSYRKEAFAADARRLVPEVRESDLARSYTGIVAKLLHRDGELVDEHTFEHGERSTHVLYVIPGLTSSLAVGEHVGDAVAERL